MKQWADPTRDRKRLRRPQLQRAQRTNTAEVLKAVVLRFVGPVRPCAISSKKRVMMRSAWTEPSDGEPASPRSWIIFARLYSHNRRRTCEPISDRSLVNQLFHAFWWNERDLLKWLKFPAGVCPRSPAPPANRGTRPVSAGPRSPWGKRSNRTSTTAPRSETASQAAHG